MASPGWTHSVASIEPRQASSDPWSSPSGQASAPSSLRYFSETVRWHSSRDPK